MQIRKIIASGFSFSGSSAMVDFLTDHEGVVAFPGGEARPLCGTASFASLTGSIRKSGVVTPDIMDNCLEFLRGNRKRQDVGERYDSAVSKSVAAYRKAFGALYDTCLETLERDVMAHPTDAQAVRAASHRFINTLCEDLAARKKARIIVFDQGVRPWALSRLRAYDQATVFIVRRDIRDQIIERARHGFEDAGFEEEMAERVRKSRRTKRLTDYVIKPIWFENLILDGESRKDVLAACGLENAQRVGGKFNPLSSRRNIGLYDLRPDLAKVSPSSAFMFHPGIPMARLVQSEVADRIAYESAPAGVAGAYGRTRPLDSVPVRSP